MATTTVTQTAAGTYSWVCPTGVTSVQIECWGGGGAGGQRTTSGGGGGGGGGEYAKEAALAVVPGTSYTYVVGAAGASGSAAGNGGSSTFNTTGVVAHGGTGVAQNVLTGGAGGTGSTNTTHFNGGAGFTSAGTTGGGGGGSGGTAAVGTTATSATGSTAVTGGGPGGTGATTSNTNGGAPASGPGGGGGGADRTNSGTRVGGAGFAGKVVITYTTPLIGAFTDTFDAGVGANWNTTGSNTPAEVTAFNGGVKIAHTAAPEYNQLNFVYFGDLTGSGAYVQIADFGNQALGSHDTVFILLLDGTHYVRVLAEAAFIYFQKNIGAGNVTLASAALDQTAHRWWRIRESGGTTFWDTSPDGSTWTNRWSGANPITATSLQVQLQSGCFNTEASASFAVFDNFNVVSTKTAALVDNFATKDTTKWAWSANAVQANTQVQLPPAGTAAAINANANYDLIGSSIYVAAVSTAAAGTTYLNCYVGVLNATSYATIFENGGNITFGETVAGVNDYTTITYDATAHLWWRIRESGGTIFWDTSPDGVNWTNRKSKAAGSPYSTVVPQLYADGASGTSIFDNFNYTPPKASSLVDDFATKDTSKWGWDGTAGVVSGQANQIPTLNTADNDIHAINSYDLIGSSFVVQLVQPPNVGAGQTTAVAFLNTTLAGTFVYVQWHANGGSPITILGEQNAGVDDSLQLTYDAVNHQWLRIRESGGTIYWDTSPDGVTWTNRKSKTPTISLIQLYPTFYTYYTGTEPSPGTVIWDNVNLPPKVSTLVDDFATQDFVKWGWGAGASISSGQLQLPVHIAYDSYVQSGTYNLIGSAAYVQFAQAPNVGNGTTEAWFRLGPPPVGNNDYLGIIWASGSLYFRETVAGISSNTSITYDPVAHQWLRIRESGGTIYWETSPDSTTWTTQRSKIAGLAVNNMQAQLFSGYWGTEPSPGTAIFDNFNTPSSGLTATAADTAGITDAAAKDFGRTATDTIGATDAVALDRGVPPTASTIGITDTPTIDRGPSPTDTVGATDTATKDFGRTASDTVGVTDATALDRGVPPTSSTISITDTPTVDRGPTPTDSVGIADTISNALGKNPADTVGLSDAITKDFGRNPADTVGILDSFSADLISTNDFVSDTVFDVGGLVLDSHVGELGAAWAKHTGSTGVATVQNNRMWFDATGSAYHASGTPPSADYAVKTDVTFASLITNSYAGVAARMQSGANTFYMAFPYYDGSTVNIYIKRNVAGTGVNLANTLVTLPTVGSTHKLRLEVRGTSLTAYWDDVAVVGPITDSNISAAGSAGILGQFGSASTGMQLDNVVASIFGSQNYNVSATESIGITGIAGASTVGPDAYVTRHPTTGNLLFHGKRYRAAGANCANDIGTVSSSNGNGYSATVDTSHYITPHTQVAAVINSAQQMNMTALKATWACITVGTPLAVQPTRGVFNPAALDPIDYAISLCGPLGIKLVLPFCEEPAGTKQWYVTNRTNGPLDDFYTDANIIADYKAHISFVLNHLNPYTGLALKDDPTIICWQTGNEFSVPTLTWAQYAAWGDDIGHHIKIIEGAKQLVMDGHYGINIDDTDPVVVQQTYVDLYDDHSYNSTRTAAWMAAHDGDFAHAYGKAFSVGEYTWTDDTGTTGGHAAVGWLLTNQLTGYETLPSIDLTFLWDLLAPLTSWGDGFTLHYPPDATLNSPSLTQAQNRSVQLSDHCFRMPGIAPRIFASDTFTDTDGNVLSTHVPDLGAWSFQNGYVGIGQIKNNRLCSASGATQVAYYSSGIPASTDYIVSADIFTQTLASGSWAGVIVRGTAAIDTSYTGYVYYNGTVVNLWLTWQAGDHAFSGQTSSFTISAPAVSSIHSLQLKCQNVGASTVLTLYWDGVPSIVITDTAPYFAAGRAGLYFGGSSPTTGFHIDNFVATDLITSMYPPVRRPNHGALLQL